MNLKTIKLSLAFLSLFSSFSLAASRHDQRLDGSYYDIGSLDPYEMATRMQRASDIAYLRDSAIAERESRQWEATYRGVVEDMLIADSQGKKFSTSLVTRLPDTKPSGDVQSFENREYVSAASINNGTNSLGEVNSNLKGRLSWAERFYLVNIHLHPFSSSYLKQYDYRYDANTQLEIKKAKEFLEIRNRFEEIANASALDSATNNRAKINALDHFLLSVILIQTEKVKPDSSNRINRGDLKLLRVYLNLAYELSTFLEEASKHDLDLYDLKSRKELSSDLKMLIAGLGQKNSKILKLKLNDIQKLAKRQLSKIQEESQKEYNGRRRSTQRYKSPFVSCEKFYTGY